jgi:hypothetical protein
MPETGVERLLWLRLCCAGLLVILVSLSCSRASAQDSGGLERSLRASVQSYSISARNWAEAAVEVASAFGVPMAIEWTAPTHADPVVRQWKNTTVGEVLKSLVPGPGYTLTEQDGLVHITYEGALEDATNFLNVRLAQFEVRSQFVAVALDDLGNQVKQTVSPSVRQRMSFREIMKEPNDHRISLSVADQTVRDVLDHLSLASGHKIWVVTFPKEGGVVTSGFRRTASLWNNYPIPDRDQPIWDRFVWGAPLPTEWQIPQ